MAPAAASVFRERNASLIAEATRQLLDRFLTIEAETDPWPHAVAPGFLPPQLYAQLVQVLSGQDRQKLSGDGTGRHFLTINPQTYACGANLMADLDFWSGRLDPLLGLVLACFSDRLVRNKLFLRFKQVQRSVIGRATSLEREKQQQANIEVRLVYDDPTYDLLVHTDLEEKIFSILVYIPLDDQSQADGTSLYAPRKPGFRDDGSHYMPVDQFELRKTMPFAENHAFMFFRTDTSFHAKPRAPSSARTDRYSLQINYVSPGQGLSPWNGVRRATKTASELMP